MSTKVNVGLLGLSIHINLVSGRIISAISTSIDGENVTTTPCALATCVKYRCVPPYTSDTETTWDPAARDWRIVAVVAEPDEKASANRACSRAATAVSKLSLSSYQSETTMRTCCEYLFGFELRTYSYAPTGLPTPICAKVVDREI